MRSKWHTHFPIILLIVMSARLNGVCQNTPGSADKESLRVLANAPAGYQADKMLFNHLRRLSDEAIDGRDERYDMLKTEDQIRIYQEKLRHYFLKQLDLPAKTPLKPQIIQAITFEGYRLEKIIYESQPGFFVSALLYLPLSDPPFPGVLVICGHSETGKSAYQEICVSLVRHGMAVLCPDPIGQGERKQILDKDGKGLVRSTTEHMISGVAPILLGTNLAGYMFWDAVRAIDYLCKRPEIDPTRIGSTGISGGGNRTSYLLALENRLAAAAPGCFITTTRRKNLQPGPGDAEQNIHGQIAAGMDHADYLIMGAVKPTLILAATRDFLPIEGTWESFRQAKRIYTRLGFPERLELIEADAPHGFSKDLQIGAVRWMRRWLLGKDDAVTEEDFTPLSSSDLQCTPAGQVLLLPEAKSIFALNAEKEKLLSKQRKIYIAETDKKNFLAKIRSLTGIRCLEDLPAVQSQLIGKLKREEYCIEKWLFHWDTDIFLPALLFKPAIPGGNVYLYLSDNGKQTDAGHGGPIEKLVREGNTVLAVDLRGFGETAVKVWRYPDAQEYTGVNAAEFFMSYKLNRSLLGMRAEDILVSARWLIEHTSPKSNGKVNLLAKGETGPVALHAMALEPGLFNHLQLNSSLSSWSDAIRSTLTRGVFNNTVHGALKYYDLPDLLQMIGREKTKIIDPVNAAGAKL